MPLTLAPRSDTHPASLLDRLHQARSRYRFLTNLRGGSQLLGVSLVAVALAVYLDWRYHLPALVRASALVSILTAGGVLLGRWLIRPFCAAHSLLTTAIRIERKFPELNDSLASAVEFLGVPELDTEQSSPWLRRQTIEHALTLCADLDFNEAFTRRGTKRTLLASLALMIAAGWLVQAAPVPSAIGLERLARPFDDRPWPAKTRIEILDPRPMPARLARGESLELRIAMRGVIPDRVKMAMCLEGASPQEQLYSMPRTETGEQQGLLTLRIDGQRLIRNFRFQLKANDAETPWYAVSVYPPPTLVPLNGRPSPQIDLVFPAYTDLAPMESADATSVVEAPAGTLVTLRAAVDRPVVQASLAYQPEHTRLTSAACLAPWGSFHPLGAAACFALSRDVYEPIPLRIGEAGQRIDCTFIPRLPGPYLLKFEDESGLAGTRLFDFRIHPDPAPVVTLVRPVAGRDSLAVLPTAEITLEAVAADKIFGLKDVFIEYRTSPTGSMRRMPLFDAAMLGKLLPKLALLMHGAMPIPAVEAGKYPAFALQQRMGLARFTHEDGASLQEGDVLILRIAATDFDTVNPIKQPGRSQEIELRIASRSHLETTAQQSLANLRGELLHLRELQREARSKVAEAIADQQRSGTVRPEDQEKILQAAQLQQQIRARIQSPEDGLTADAARLKQMVHDNRLPKSRATDRIDMVLGELNRLTAETFDPLDQALAEARKPSANDPSALKRAERSQREVEDTLKSLLERLEPWSGAGEVRGEARAILNELSRHIEQTQQLKDRQQPGTSGTKREQLSPEQQAELDRAAIRPDRLSDRTHQLIEKLDRLAAEKKAALKEKEDLLQKKQAESKRLAAEAKNQPAESDRQKSLQRQAADLEDQTDDLRRNRNALKAEIDALERSVVESNRQTLKQQLQQVGEQLRQNRLDGALRNQQAGLADLQKVVDSLEEKSPASSEDLLEKKRREASHPLERLIEKQELLQKKIDAARQLPDPRKRREELQKLAKEQEQLQRETEALAQRLSRAQADGAAQELRRAARQMEATQQRLERGESPERSTEESLDRLDDAHDRLERVREQDEAELLRDKLMQVGDAIRAVRDRQQTAVAECSRLQNRVRDARGWANEKSGPVLRTNLNHLLEQQEGLSKELEGLVEKRFQSIPVFERMLRQSAAAMTQAGQRLKQRKEDALDQVDGTFPFNDDVEKKAFGGILDKQRLALKRLDQLLEALKPDPEMLQARKPAEPSPMSAKMAEGDELPPLAQLKALRALQVDVAERTAIFDKAHPEARSKWSDDDIADLRSLQEAQEDVAKLIRELTPTDPLEDAP